jgi:SAM-dependent methyltransferase
MGCTNQLSFIKENLRLIKGPVLEVGSKDYGSTPDLRPFLPGCQYVGIDMEAGKGVDLVLDLTDDLSAISARLPVAKFNTVICFSVLEHCCNPFKMCANISDLLNPGGLVFVSVPFSWKIHGFPSDYWRFTPQAIRVLFPGFDFDAHAGHLTTSVEGETGPIDDAMMRIELSAKKGMQRKAYGPLTALCIYAAKKLRLMPYIFHHRYLFPPIMINMVGIKK